ncbi:hypothetical protein GCM10010377_06370 [Streptomyces viridiviolaceus]|uniref:FXSXX-COOH protein n=1 Tax=Streptomyces viridiviolaceus TaxID=68282 RepID=A0ABW2E5P2_9ACTN|nr:hypothetical protein [Streptomyces viridiviolaceus]GHB19246.1 hypothetical protein GCM10010377_06370 [Streptomyces viridiviolaceus]
MRATARDEASGAGEAAWESDLSDLAALPLAAVDRLAPLGPGTRLLDEVLRARSSMRGGGEGGGGARAE